MFLGVTGEGALTLCVIFRTLCIRDHLITEIVFSCEHYSMRGGCGMDLWRFKQLAKGQKLNVVFMRAENLHRPEKAHGVSTFGSTDCVTDSGCRD